MAEKPTAQSCPYCGVTTDVPHESQEGCIEALHSEIARMRELLQFVKAPERDPVSETPERDHDELR